MWGDVRSATVRGVPTSCVVLAIAVLSSVTVVARQNLTLTPTVLETFAARPDATTTWSKELGRLAGDNMAIVSAVALTSPTSTPSTMRGIRIELRHEGAQRSCDLKYVEWSVLCARDPAVVLIEESRLDGLRTAVLGGRAEVHPGHAMGITTYRSGSNGDGVLMFGYELRGRTLAEFADLVAQAEAALRAAPR